jgi:hypothetical protein
MKKQTAIDWLGEQVKSKENQKSFSILQWLKIIEKAKEMEKEQIEEAWKRGNLPTSLGRVLTEKDYYNETYGHNK